ncbi:lamin tail domain-containing protein 1 [Sorex fumeus]|uniref:lamin tail domain-containing protein 1 n=1 Tax=Sorex fumeus TaxID=62283 RepID=UPI0024AD796B|nr:lamin tail domain-containing protein 1 [Sorex fumeus]
MEQMERVFEEDFKVVWDQVRDQCVGRQQSSVFRLPKKQDESAVIGEGEDYFLSLFGHSRKMPAHPLYNKKKWTHFSMILEDLGQTRRSALGDVKIAEVNNKGLFVKLVNSSLDKELEIGSHILQQKVKGQTVSLYQFIPNVIMQAQATVTVWAAASEAHHQPPSDFLWKEQETFRTSPNCTTILCQPNGEAVAWYTPVHWQQAWEKLETDIDFDRNLRSNATSKRRIFQWPKVAGIVSRETEDWCEKSSVMCQQRSSGNVSSSFFHREQETPPLLFPHSSPWCHSCSCAPHPYCSLIECDEDSGKQAHR